MSADSASSHDVDVLFDGTEIPDTDIISFVVESDLDQPDMATITLRNDTHEHTGARNHGQSVEIKVGGGDGSNKKTIFKGEIVGIEPAYKAGGEGSKVVIRAFNKLHRLLRGKKSKTFQQQSDQDIVSSIAGQYGLSPQCGSSPKITHEHVYQHAQTDLEFIRVRAARLGFHVWVEDTKLFFDKPKKDVDSGIELKLDRDQHASLKAVHFRLTSANVVKKVVVRGWDPKKKEEIVGEEQAQSSPLGSSGAASASSSFGDTATYTVDHPIYSVEEAKAIAKGKLEEHLMSYITGEAECRGNPDIKTGVVVKIVVNVDNTSDRFNGKYYVRGVTHKYTHGTGGNPSGGYVTIARLSRDAEK